MTTVQRVRQTSFFPRLFESSLNRWRFLDFANIELQTYRLYDSRGHAKIETISPRSTRQGDAERRGIFEKSQILTALSVPIIALAMHEVSFLAPVSTIATVRPSNFAEIIISNYLERSSGKKGFLRSNLHYRSPQFRFRC